MSVLINFEILEYNPTNLISISGLKLAIKCENKQIEDNIPNKANLVLKIERPKKDLKLIFKLNKGNTLIALGELTVSQLALAKKEESLTKVVQLTMSDLNRKLLFGSNSTQSNSIKITVKANFVYAAAAAKTGADGSTNNAATEPPVRSSSAKPMSSMREPKTTAKKDTSGLQPSVTISQNQNNKSASKRDQANISPINLKQSLKKSLEINTATTVEKKNSKKIDSNNDLKKTQIDLDESVIDPLISNPLPQLEEDDEGKTLKELFEELSQPIKLDEDEFNLDYEKEKAKVLIQKLFLLQECYYKKFNDKVVLNKQLRSILLNYNEKFRIIQKKNNRLQEAIETLNTKSKIVNALHKNNNEVNTQYLLLNKTELETYKQIFGVQMGKKELNDFKEQTEHKTDEKKKKILLTVLENLNKKGKLNNENVNSEQKQNLSYIAAKYGLILEINNNNINVKENIERNSALSNIEEKSEDEIMITSALKNKENEQEIDRQDFSPISNNDNNPRENNKSAKQQSKRLTVIDCKIPEETDFKLDEKMMEIINKKRLSQIPMKKLSQNNYKYGTQTLIIKFDGDAIKVKIDGSGYISLDKFIEINAPIEEIKLKKMSNLTNSIASANSNKTSTNYEHQSKLNSNNTKKRSTTPNSSSNTRRNLK